MAFMRMYIYPKGRTLSGDCAKCRCSTWLHPDTRNDYAHDCAAITQGALRCDHCADGIIDPETVVDHGNMYAGRYSANGYMDCTEWSYGHNRRALTRELRDMYGDD